MTSPSATPSRSARAAAARLAAAVALAVLAPATLAAPATAATAGTAAEHRPQEPDVSNLDGRTRDCGGFLATFDVVRSNTFLIRRTQAADGTVTELVTGSFVVEVTGNGKTLTFNASGPTTTTITPDGQLTQVGHGPQLNSFGPVGQLATGGLPIVYSTGRTVLVVDLTRPLPTVTEFSATGQVVDVCALLR